MPLDPMHLTRLALVLAGIAAAVAYRREIQQAIERLNGRGPGPQTGPLPANDSALLLRKRTGPALPRLPHPDQE